MRSEHHPGAHRNAARTRAGAPLRLQVAGDPLAVDGGAWNALLARQAAPTPFMRHEYLAALHASGSAVPATGWQPHWLLLWDGGELAAACPLYLKTHSYGEYVFDWSWASAHAEHGLNYYPKALVAVPFTPVPGSRLLARDAAARAALLQALLRLCRERGLSSLHLLYGDEADLTACEAAGLMLRQQVQFHWKNMKPPRSPAARGPLPPEEALAALGRPGGGSGAGEARMVETEVAQPFTDFADFLAALQRDKRKKIRQERRRVADAGVRIRHARGRAISGADWAFFYRCYERTYLEHGNAPYLTPDFFGRMARDMADDWVLFIAERDGRPIASSLIAISTVPASANGPNDSQAVAWGRYWGALERVDCLHFELCYYAPIAWCIAHDVARFEGGAQGEHKMARALLPVVTPSAHWLAHPAFADAVERFLAREDEAMACYLARLRAHSPLREATEER